MGCLVNWLSDEQRLQTFSFVLRRWHLPKKHLVDGGHGGHFHRK